MHPVLFTVPLGRREIAISTYGVLVTAGLAIGIWAAQRQGRRRGFDSGAVMDLAFWTIVAGLIGARLTYGLVNAREFWLACTEGPGPRWHDCTSVFRLWEGGLVFYGGVAAAAGAALLFARRQGWSFGEVGDVGAPALAIGHAFGRLGCFAAGCCFGKETAARVGMSFPRGSVAFDVLRRSGDVPFGAGETPPLHPTQVYEAAGEAVIFAVLWAASPRLRRRPGALLTLYLGLYAALRFVVEIFRGDALRGMVLSLRTPGLARRLGLAAGEPLFLSVGQLGSLVIAAVLLTLFVRRRRGTQTPAP
ncbi:MAG TPA: prolipoprotein diacylglyceryl transferase [Polyangia bacterium]|nr:prolipoprotein diacylglyceryl transferase [Polyangia bacterium]